MPSQPRIALGSWAFAFSPFDADPWPFERVCRYAADTGYDGVEIGGFRPHLHDEDHSDDASCAPLRELLDELGLGVSGYAPDFSSTPPAEVPHADYLTRVDSVLAFCRRIGSPLVRVDSMSPPGPVDAARFDHLATVWRETAVRAADSGVGLVWEFEPGFFINRPSDVVRLVDAVDHPNFRILFDTSHARAGAAGARQGADPEVLAGAEVEYARLLAGRVGHFHVIDGDGSLHDDETSAHLPFGAGHVDFPGVLAALGPAVAELPWWTVDFCFCPTTVADAEKAVPIVRDMITSVSA